MNTKPVVAQNLLRKSDIKILLVDDREDNLYSIEAIFEKDNYTIVKANSGREALKVLLKEQDFSLILMDVQMPEMDGLQATAAIRKGEVMSGKHIPIIAMTAHAMVRDKEHCLKAGMDDYITKPIRLEQLLDVLERYSLMTSTEKVL